MTCTNICIISIILNILFLAAITWFIVKHFQQRKRIKQLVNELGSDSLEHYLNEIKGRGFDFTLKPKGKKKGKE
jgi:hypothetical protein